MRHSRAGLTLGDHAEERRHQGTEVITTLPSRGGSHRSRRCAPSQHHTPTPDQKNEAGALVKIVRESTERFRNVTVAEAEGYALQFGCVSGSDAGAMGLHFVNGSLVNEGVLDATRPQIVIYEPLPNGTLRLIGAHTNVSCEAFAGTNP